MKVVGATGKMKVWWRFDGGPGRRIIVVAPTRNEAMELVGLTKEARGWLESENPADIELAQQLGPSVWRFAAGRLSRVFQNEISEKSRSNKRRIGKRSSVKSKRTPNEAAV